eukprot:TRINITY_DN3983_c0_g1_i9.p3 TRINITY_DN3983_c0_g1~~TRINITY_DN3983_c0_g1_i9.p3  ORF type:complete len:115 (+),score=15.69 TRINITY_DN3983_c0_g1_i9:1070-1414(+)
MASVVTSLSGSHSSLSLLKPTRLSDIQMSYNLAQFHFTFAFGALYLGLIFAGWNLTNIPDPEKMGIVSLLTYISSHRYYLLPLPTRSLTHDKVLSSLGSILLFRSSQPCCTSGH